MSVIVVEKSQNSKVGEASATYASQATCPDTCPFQGAGCYAESGPCGLILKRLNASEIKDPNELAKMEAEGIKNLSGNRQLRLHVVGDCKTKRSAEILAEACESYSNKVWCYTHNRSIPRKSWGNISILRSCETLRQAEEATKSGFGVSMVVPSFKENKRYYLGRGLYGIPCPAQVKGIKCVDCKLCLNSSKLGKNVVLIAAHGVKKKDAIQAVGG